MTSLRLRLVGGVMRPVVRYVLQRAQEVDKLRRQFDFTARLWFRNVPGACYLPTRFTSADQLPALWVSSGPVTSDKVVLYLHGGGYLAGSPEIYKRLVSRLCRMTGMRAFVPAYRLAPENPLPAGLDDAEAAFDHLLSCGYRSDQIVIGGDSAGGGLALALLARLTQTGRHPVCAFAWSPFCDQSFSGASIQENEATDHFFPSTRLQELTTYVSGGLAVDDPKVSPLWARFEAPPPVILQASDSEILRDDAVRMAEVLRKAGGVVDLHIWSDAPHIWQIFDGWFPEARQAIRQTADFLNSHAES